VAQYCRVHRHEGGTITGVIVIDMRRGEYAPSVDVRVPNQRAFVLSLIPCRTLRVARDMVDQVVRGLGHDCSMACEPWPD
jgi:hypothetical protein